MPPSPIQQHFTGGAGTFHDGGDLRNAHTGHDARGADGAGPDAHLHGVGAGLQHGAGAFIGRHVARDELAIRERALDGGHGIQNVLGVAVRGVEHEHVNARGDEGGGALLAFRAHADGRADAQAALAVLTGIGVLLDLVDVLHGKKPGKLTLFVNHEQLFDAVGVQVVLGFLKRGSGGNGDQVFAGHHVPDLGPGEIFNKTDVAVGQDADQLLFPDHGQAGHAVRVHEIQRVLDGVVGLDGDGIDDHAAFGFLDLFDLQLLALDAHILVHDADAAGAGHGNGHRGLGHGIHRGGNQRNIQRYGRSQPSGHVHHIRRDFRIGGHQQHIIEGQAFAQNFGHRALLRTKTLREVAHTGGRKCER